MDHLPLTARARWRQLSSAFCVLLIMLLAAAPAQARSGAPARPAQTAPLGLDVSIPLFPVAENNAVPPHFHVSPARAAAIAKHTPQLIAIHRHHHPLHYLVLWMPRSHYEVDFWYQGKAIAGVVVWPSGKLGPVYTGAEVLGTYSRGHYSTVFDSPLTWVPFTLLFLVALLAIRGRSWLDRFDLGVVLTFGLSYYLFDTQHLVPAVWLCYPPLLYLLARMLMRGFGWSRRRSCGRRVGPVDVALPTWFLVGGLVALVAGRIAVALIPTLVMDVGYASLIGAYKIAHGQPIYFASLGHPDTYGPITYLAYLPFELIWPLKSWLTYTPAVRAATISFDLLTIGGLLVLGHRLRAGREGWRLGLLMAWLWAACPFTVLGLAKNTNDGLTALFMVAIMLAWSAPVRRGALLGLASAAKFFPGILLPLVALRHRPGRQPAWKRALIGFTVAAGASVAAFLPPGGIQEVWSHTIGYQLTRPDIFSPWALHPSLAPIKDALTVLAAGLAVLVAFRPRGPLSTAQIAAFGAALIIAVQLPAVHWFYLYIVWFIPFVVIAVLAPGVPAPASASSLAMDTTHAGDDSGDSAGALLPVS